MDDLDVKEAFHLAPGRLDVVPSHDTALLALNRDGQMAFVKTDSDVNHGTVLLR